MSKKLTVPAGFKVSPSKIRGGEMGSSYVAFVDKAQGIFESKKGAVARDRTMEGVIAKLNDPATLAKVTRVSRAPAVKAAAKTTKPAAKARANEDLETID